MNSVELLVWRLVKGGAVVATSSGVLPIVADRAPLDMQLLDGQAEDGDGGGHTSNRHSDKNGESWPAGDPPTHSGPLLSARDLRRRDSPPPRVPQRREPSQRSA